MHWYLHTLKQYAVFKGRAPRQQYWFFVLFQVLAVLLISFCERALAIANPEILFGWFTALYLLITLLPTVAVSARRLHDSALSAWWLWLYSLPLLGCFILQLLMLRSGTQGFNRYGLDPRLKGP